MAERGEPMMNHISRVLFCCGILGVFSGAVYSEDDHESGLAFKFDLNHDGVITRAEFDKAFAAKMDNKLIWLDTNQDGMISPQEFRAQHRSEYEQRWTQWDSDGDGEVSVESVLEQQQAKRAGMRKAIQPDD
jgi:Ca2+-binding EF-hand superfamily protein